jgi:filamentous hemagglutinin family protein
MANTYNIRTNRRELLRQLNEEQRYILSENVVLHGRGAENYHLDRNQNLVYRLENFAGSPSPTTPLDGQLWWDIQNQNLMVYNQNGISCCSGQRIRTNRFTRSP